MMSDLLVGTLTGMIVATLLTESYRLAPDTRQTRTAMLAARPEPPLREIVFAARLLAVAAFCGGMWNAGLTEGVFNAGGAYLALILCGMAELTQRAITDRRRPTEERAALVDQRLREFAGRSVAWLELAASCLALGWTLSRLVSLVWDSTGQPFLGWASFTLMVVAIVATHKSSGWPPLGWKIPQPQQSLPPEPWREVAHDHAGPENLTGVTGDATLTMSGAQSG
jgi:hypothetical protein